MIQLDPPCGGRPRGQRLSLGRGCSPLLVTLPPWIDVPAPLLHIPPPLLSPVPLRLLLLLLTPPIQVLLVLAGVGTPRVEVGRPGQGFKPSLLARWGFTLGAKWREGAPQGRLRALVLGGSGSASKGVSGWASGGVGLAPVQVTLTHPLPPDRGGDPGSITPHRPVVDWWVAGGLVRVRLEQVPMRARGRVTKDGFHVRGGFPLRPALLRLPVQPRVVRRRPALGEVYMARLRARLSRHL